MAVDRDQRALFDEEDATKVRLHDGHVIGVGKTLVEWDVIDAGVFHCTPALFAALRESSVVAEHSLSTAVDLLASASLVEAVDITGDFWFDVDTEAGRREAERLMRKSLGKVADDGYVAANLNRPLSTRLTARLAGTAIRPNHVTIAAFLLALAAAGLFATDTYGLGGARRSSPARLLHPRWGGWRARSPQAPHHSTRGLAGHHHGSLCRCGGGGGSDCCCGPGHRRFRHSRVDRGMAAATGFILASYTTKEFQLRYGRPYPNDMLAKPKKRDLRLLTISVGAVLGSPYLAAVSIGILSHLCIVGILARGWKEGS